MKKYIVTVTQLIRFTQTSEINAETIDAAKEEAEGIFDILQANEKMISSEIDAEEMEDENICPDCDGVGEVFESDGGGRVWRKCLSCKGSGEMK